MSIVIPWILFVASVVFFVCYRREVKRRLSILSKEYTVKLQEYASSLQSTRTEWRLALEEAASYQRLFISMRDSMWRAEADADRLAPIVRQYVKDIDDTAALLKDETPPPLIAEREAMRLHDEAIKLRTK